MKSNFHLNQINRIFDERRLRNHRIYVDKKNEVYSAIPEYMKLDKFVTDAADIDITAIINGDKNALSKTKESLKNIEQRKKQLLAEHGFPADYLEPVYTCPDCKDTGYIDNRRCHCFKSELLKILYKESNLDKRLALENFSTFDINRYSDDYIISDSDITPRENILKVLDTCKDFIHNFNNFPDERRNLLIYGNSGVGKTFLTNCIAKEILDKGYSVIYLTSYELFDALQVLKQTDVSTMAHSINVSIIARLIGVWAGLDTEKLDEISMAGLLHDIGKFKIPDEILLKPGKLTKDEFEVIKKHTIYGYEILKSFNILESTKRAALLHHEKFDGSGYPFGYKSDKIDDISAIITIADVYDAMTSKRCYRDGMCPFEVIADFEYDGISKYHPKYIGMFLKKIASSYIGSTVLLTNGKKAKIIFVTEKYSRPTVTLLEDNSVLALKDEKDIKIAAVL